MVDQSSHAAIPEAELNRALELIFHAQKAITAPPDAILAQFGWNRVHHRILYFVARQPGISQQALLGILGVSKQALHGPMRQLIEARLVENSPSAADRRVRCLSLTASGLDLEQRLSNPQRELLARAFQSAGNSATVSWVATMQAICSTAIPPQNG